MGALAIRNIHKTYNETVHILKGIDLEIEAGEFLILVGPSGCGKSTLLRMVAGLEDISGGTISIGDRVVNDLEPAERDIAMVFQNYALYPHMSVYDNMAYGLKIRKFTKADIDKRVNAAAAILELEGFLKRKPRELSGGQRQRVAMGRAIVRQPAVFLFDEPLSNLDAKLRTGTRAQIVDLQRRLGRGGHDVGHAGGDPLDRAPAVEGGGDVVGDHTVHLLGDSERLELTHRATNRDLFARGALSAAAYVATQGPGRYTISNVLDG